MLRSLVDLNFFQKLESDLSRTLVPMCDLFLRHYRIDSLKIISKYLYDSNCDACPIVAFIITLSKTVCYSQVNMAPYLPTLSLWHPEYVDLPGLCCPSTWAVPSCVAGSSPGLPWLGADWTCRDARTSEEKGCLQRGRRKDFVLIHKDQTRQILRRSNMVSLFTFIQILLAPDKITSHHTLNTHLITHLITWPMHVHRLHWSGYSTVSRDIRAETYEMICLHFRVSSIQ